MHRYQDRAVDVSIDVPHGWDIAATSEFQLLLLAPEQDGFRANVGLSRARLDPPTAERLAEVSEQAKADRMRDAKGFVLDGERRVVHDGAAGWLMRSRWELDDAPIEVAQVSALYLTEDGRLYQVHCTSLAERAGDDLPVFRHLLESLRFSSGDGATE